MRKVLDGIFENKLTKILFFTFLSLLIYTFSYSNGMFWDNVLFASKIGIQLFNNGIFNWYIPDSFDPGHPPTLGFLLAITWNIFGQNLWSSHLLMIPFTFGLFYQIYKLIFYYTKTNLTSFLGLLLIFADPTLFTQLVLVNPEVIQLFFFFLAVNSILYKRFTLKIIALFLLSIISYRSMMLCFGIFLFEFLNNLIIDKQRIKAILSPKFLLSYLIGSIPAVFYILWRLLNKGWLQTHPNSPWSESWQFVTLNEFFRNIVILIHRYSDFGRIFILLFIIFSLFKFKKAIFRKDIKQLLLLGLTSVFLIIVISLLSTNSMGHRYFIPSYIVLILISFIILTHYYVRQKSIYIFLFLGLFLGNLWIYPKQIAQGWDASLAHVPYHNLRTEAIEYLNHKNIEIEEVATFFPNITKISNIDLNEDDRSFTNFTGKEKYLFYSNVYNLNDEDYKIIDNNYILLKEFNKFRIHIYIYKHK